MEETKTFWEPRLALFGQMGFDFWPHTLKLHSNRDIPPVLGGACCPGAEGHALTGTAVPAQGCLLDTRLSPARRGVMFLGACRALCGRPGGREWFGGGTHPICASSAARRRRGLPRESPLCQGRGLHQLLISAKNAQRFLAPSLSVLGEID